MTQTEQYALAFNDWRYIRPLQHYAFVFFCKDVSSHIMISNMILLNKFKVHRKHYHASEPNLHLPMYMRKYRTVIPIDRPPIKGRRQCLNGVLIKYVARLILFLLLNGSSKYQFFLMLNDEDLKLKICDIPFTQSYAAATNFFKRMK